MINMKSESTKNIALVGFMGTGKTKTGKLLAKMLKMEFVDVDHEIEKMARVDIPTLVRTHGEIRFMELEIQAIARCCRKKNAVISCGGGAILNLLNTIRLRKNARLFLLSAHPKELVRRLRNEMNRPLSHLDDEEKEIRIAEILEARKSFYDATGAIRIKTDGKTPKKVAMEIIKSMNYKGIQLRQD